MVVVGNRAYYVSQDGNYVITDTKLHNLETNSNLTKRAFKKVVADRLYALDSDNFISFGNKDAKYEVVVVTDVNCGPCRRFHSEITAVNDLDIRVKYLLVPMLGADSRAKSVRVWCSADRYAALHEAYNDTPVSSQGDCPNPIDYNLALFLETGLRGPTPMLIFPDGTIRYGLLDPDDLLKILQEKLSAASRSQIQK